MPMPLTYSERKELTDMVERMRMRLPHPIAQIDCPIYWDGDTRAEGVEDLAAFHHIPSHKIMLAEFGKHTLDMMVPALCHELHHKWQLETWGRWSYMCRCILRNWLVEPSAYKVQEAAEKLLGQSTTD
jgi:hypothetical protein